MLVSSFTEWKTEKLNFPVFKCLLMLSRCGHLVPCPHPQSHRSSVFTVLLPSTEHGVHVWSIRWSLGSSRSISGVRWVCFKKEWHQCSNAELRVFFTVLSWLDFCCDCIPVSTMICTDYVINLLIHYSWVQCTPQLPTGPKCHCSVVEGAVDTGWRHSPFTVAVDDPTCKRDGV